MSMLKLNNTFKPLSKELKAIPINNKKKGMSLNSDKVSKFNSFKEEFLKIQQQQASALEMKQKQLKEQSEQMEAQFVKMMLNSMRKTINKSGFIDGGRGEEIFTDMLYDKYAESMSKNTDFGIAEGIYRQLSGGLF